MPNTEDQRGSVSSAVEARAKAGLRVLLVGIDPAKPSFLAQLLTLKGHEVRVAADERVARAAGWVERADVVLHDLDATDGQDSLIQELECPAYQKRPLVIIIGSNEAQTPNAALRKTSGDLHLVKPFNPWLVVQLVGRFQTIISP